MKNTLEQATRRYNSIMFDLCREYATIDTTFSEEAEKKKQWTIRDMVSEMQYTLDIYQEHDSVYYEDAHDDCQPVGRPWYKQWRNECARMQRFIDRFEEEALKTKCFERHCSEFDNFDN